MNNSEPSVSIVTATFNSMRFFEKTKQSVFSAGIDDFEWIVVDDGSVDGTRDYLRTLSDARVRVHLKDKNTGIGDSYEIGVGLARGRYILILDHDDTVPGDSLVERINALESHPESNVAFGPVAYMDEEGLIYQVSKFPFLKRSGLVSSARVLAGVFFAPAYPLKQGCVVLRTAFVRTVPRIFDIALFLSAVRSGPVAFIDQPCLNYRTFRNQFSSSRKMRLIKFFHFYWARYAFEYLPWLVSLPVALYRTALELAKVLWCFISPKRV